MHTIAIFGGSQENTFKKIGAKHHCRVLFHNGKTRNGGLKREFKNIIKKADVVIVLYGACGHVSVDCVKEVSKKLGKKVLFHKGFGASGAIQKGVHAMDKQAA
ncbi:DUF2325 domain-containing protein [Gracilibacillus sp. YIM 98692]|uniref:DUF2325 domain-containing protein n=1 Tax=Gracilibacillus sp. YIM 98692 TaxID=2663532 RepID=UPI001F093C27|nr:DUF2325 domain-containing protein [Gracilibacillus sp. YIM 98692]